MVSLTLRRKPRLPPPLLGVPPPPTTLPPPRFTHTPDRGVPPDSISDGPRGLPRRSRTGRGEFVGATPVPAAPERSPTQESGRLRFTYAVLGVMLRSTKLGMLPQLAPEFGEFGVRGV